MDKCKVTLHYVFYICVIHYIISRFVSFSTWSRGADGSAITQGSDLNDLQNRLLQIQGLAVDGFMG